MRVDNKHILLLIVVFQIATIILWLALDWMIDYSQIFSIVLVVGLVFLYFKYQAYYAYGIIMYSILGLFGLTVFTPFHFTIELSSIKFEIFNLVLFGIVVTVNLDKVEIIFKKI